MYLAQILFLGLTLTLVYQCRGRTTSKLDVSEEDIKNTIEFIRYVASVGTVVSMQVKPKTDAYGDRSGSGPNNPRISVRTAMEAQISYSGGHIRVPNFVSEPGSPGVPKRDFRAAIKKRWEALSEVLEPTDKVSAKAYGEYLKRFGKSVDFVSRTALRMGLARLSKDEFNRIASALLAVPTSKIALVRHRGKLLETQKFIYPARIIELLFDDDLLVDHFYHEHLVASDLKEITAKFLARNGSFAKYVEYDGEDGVATHVYKSNPKAQRLLLLMNRLSRILQSNPIRFKNAFQTVSPRNRTLLTKDTNSFNASSRSEFLDLIGRELLENTYQAFVSSGRWQSINSDHLMKAIRLDVKQLMGVKISLASKPSIVIGRTSSSSSYTYLDVICVGSYRRSPKQPRADFNYINFSSNKMISAAYFEASKWYGSDLKLDTNYLFRCGDQDVNIVIDSLKNSVSLPYPPKIQLPKNRATIRSLIITNMVGHTHPIAAGLFINYLKMNMGLNLAGRPQKLTNSIKEFEKRFISTDILITVADGMDMNNYPVYNSGTLYTLEKNLALPNGIKRKLIIDLILPTNNRSLSKIDSSLIQGLFSSRRKSRKPPLIVLNQACNSHDEIDFWMRAYRKSLESDPTINIQKRSVVSKLTDVPFIIGSQRSFSTSSFMDLASHMNYSMELIGSAAKGSNTKQILHALRNPSFNKKVMKNLKKEAQKKLGSIGAVNIGGGLGESVNRVDGFRPISNIEIKTQFDIKTQIEIHLKNVEGRLLGVY